MKNLLLCLAPIWVAISLGAMEPAPAADPCKCETRIDDLEWEVERLIEEREDLVRRQRLTQARVHRLELAAQSTLARDTLGSPCHDCGEPLECCVCPQEREPNPRCRCGADEGR